jgi:hypothetical protein
LEGERWALAFAALLLLPFVVPAASYNTVMTAAALSGSHDYRVRADIVYFTAPRNGAVFSTGSIAFSQSLPYNNFDNNVSRLLANVVSAFSKPGKLPGWAWSAEEKQWG